MTNDMSKIAHHVPENMLVAYAAGTLPYAFELVVAAHVSVCDECRAQLGAVECAGGAVLDETGAANLSDGLRNRILDDLDAPENAPAAMPATTGDGPYPAPVFQAMGERAPRWRSVGLGVKQAILHADTTGSVRLLKIPHGQAMPDHSHGGLELTLVLQGSFHDETGQFNTGDLEIADDTLEHTPVAGNECPCICLAATDAPLVFKGLMPRLTQRFFRI